MMSKIIIGAEEWCGFPTLGVPAIKARVDSGAKTSSIHAFNIKKFKREGISWVSFELHPLPNNSRAIIHCEQPVHDQRIIKSSTGIAEKRYVILSSIKMGEQIWEIELTLSNRESMGYKMLLGREAISSRMIIDTELSCVLGDVTQEELNQYYGKKPQEYSGLKIGLLASNPKLYSNQRIMEAGEKAGHEMQFLNIRQCYMKLDAETPEVYYRGGNALSNLDAVITRIRPSLTFYGSALTRQFESMGIYTVNSSAAIVQSRDKLFALQQMIKSGIPIPTTGFANSPIDTDDLIEMVGGAPLIVKLLEGTQGTGVVLAETDKAAESVISALKSLDANLLVQEFVKEAQGKDLRCFVIDNRVVAAIERTAAPGEFRANLHLGGKATIVKITPEERALAIKVSKMMGLKVAGVDMIRSKTGSLVLEVNSSPGLEGVEMATGKDVAGKIIASIEKKLKWEKQD